MILSFLIQKKLNLKKGDNIFYSLLMFFFNQRQQFRIRKDVTKVQSTVFKLGRDKTKTNCEKLQLTVSGKRRIVIGFYDLTALKIK